ncbi:MULTISPECIES: flagellar assembly protein FliW [unclassified Fusibacter]|uniref:flagellar assembly protein FliW n=1 Tax=unclassified Fusibacter TaxID=2624464 RepID=UPI0013E9850D|nr:MULTISPECIES: flagellar assembly protein FliW [unclassified Fusibacter]MCK8059836.1 flagellar assembly protein FliW [Fusibacter sp. A2]NPE21638.1 flagellar assembly protein FliW [Fusibacter sp. A1]
METQIIGVGKVEYQEENILHFTNGMYGFENLTRYIFVAAAEPEFPFFYLKSLERDDLQFIVTNPFLFVDKYDFELADAVVEALKIKEVSDVSVYNLVVLLDDVAKTTINLKAPIIVNHKSMLASQVILKEEYAFKHQLFVNQGDEDA